MLIELTPSGDFKVTSEFPLNVFDLERVARDIYFDHGKFVKEWPVVTESDVQIDYWVTWFIAPMLDNSYLDHEELF
jgi:hypothetical protein